MTNEELRLYIEARNAQEKNRRDLLDATSQSYYDMFKRTKTFLQLIILKK
jgi:hypothetical protein